MREVIEKVKVVYKDMCSKQFEEVFTGYFDTDSYIEFLRKQYYSLLKNIESINALLSINNIEDAYSIFRKYIETFLIMLSVLENPEIASKCITHNKYLAYKACNQNTYELRNFYRNKPDGYLSYGYIESLVDSNKEDFKYSISLVAEVAGVKEYYEWYRLSNNFVHNNMTSTKIDIEEGKNRLISLVKLSSNHFIDRLMFIIKQRSI